VLRFRPRITYANVVATLALFVALGGGAIAAGGAFTGSDGKIHGCVAGNGRLSVLKPPATKCGTGKDRIAWNQRGPRGRRGPGAKQFETVITEDGSDHLVAHANGVSVFAQCFSREGVTVRLKSTSGQPNLQAHGFTVLQDGTVVPANTSGAASIVLDDTKSGSRSAEVTALAAGKWTHFVIDSVAYNGYCIVSGLITSPSN
jgi:hypothetical protein